MYRVTGVTIEMLTAIKENITLKMTTICLSKDNVLRPSGAGEDEDEGDAASANGGVDGTRCLNAVL